MVLRVESTTHGPEAGTKVHGPGVGSWSVDPSYYVRELVII